MRASKQDREDIKLKRESWAKNQAHIDPAHLVFIDESGAKKNMTRLYGRNQKSSHLYASTPNARWSSTTMTSSIRSDDSTACMTIEGATNTDILRAYVKDILMEPLKKVDVVVIDNLSAHKNKETVALIESVGASVEFSPAYSPGLNPIELMWRKVKITLKKLEARDSDELRKAIGKALNQITPSDTINWFAHCGYNLI